MKNLITIYCADFVVPVNAPPLGKGAVAVEDSKIVAVGAKTEIIKQFPDSSVKDFGEAAIVPGLINAHAHLELTALRGYLDAAESDFSSWLLKLANARDSLMTAECLVNSALCGAIEAARAGVTCVADIGKHGFAGAKALRAVGLRGISFQENPFALNAAEANEKFAEWTEKIYRNRELENDLVRVGVTPHAPYTVSRLLFEKITDFALQESLPVTIHAAESIAEQEFMTNGTGKIAEMVKNLGIVWQAPNQTPIRYLNEIGALRTAPLLAHCVNATEEDLEIIAATKSKIAHCPKSNAKFRHGIAPFAKILEKNIAAGLGSDSVASNNLCDILDEAKTAAFFQRVTGRFLDAETVLRAATVGGATALGLDKKCGALEAGKQADFCVINLSSLPQQPVYDVYAAVVFSSTAREVIFTAVDGKPIFQNNTVLLADEARAKAKLKETARRIRSSIN
jgi:cytosine/adenosine deaminase-related metal-dependent hydrolase